MAPLHRQKMLGSGYSWAAVSLLQPRQHGGAELRGLAVPCQVSSSIPGGGSAPKAQRGAQGTCTAAGLQRSPGEASRLCSPQVQAWPGLQVCCCSGGLSLQGGSWEPSSRMLQGEPSSSSPAEDTAHGHVARSGLTPCYLPSCSPPPPPPASLPAPRGAPLSSWWRHNFSQPFALAQAQTQALSTARPRLSKGKPARLAHFWVAVVAVSGQQGCTQAPRDAP